MSHLQPTVRQLQPLGRTHHSAPVVPEEVGALARAADTMKTSAPRRRRWRRRLAARATLAS